MYLAYFRHLLPLIGRFVSKHRDAYSWLPESVLAFPAPEALAQRMRSAGFAEVSFTLLFGGICAIHVGTKR
jgi:demethylmenaquinone methyltransferase/2-methoxy-6-polyprenyl-1,4-benzoquinol methylase